MTRQVEELCANINCKFVNPREECQQVMGGAAQSTALSSWIHSTATDCTPLITLHRGYRGVGSQSAPPSHQEAGNQGEAPKHLILHPGALRCSKMQSLCDQRKK
jgi:hypothetical protein